MFFSLKRLLKFVACQTCLQWCLSTSFTLDAATFAYCDGTNKLSLLRLSCMQKLKHKLYRVRQPEESPRNDKDVLHK